jgi:transcriptional regulator with XRE-family HTH domain
MPSRHGTAAILAANLRALMLATFGRTSSPQVAKKSGVAQRTINNVEKGRFDPKLSTIDAIARVFGLEAYQLLCPVNEEKEFLRVAQAWQQADALGRELLAGAADTVIRRHVRAEARRTGS